MQQMGCSKSDVFEYIEIAHHTANAAKPLGLYRLVGAVG